MSLAILLPMSLTRNWRHEVRLSATNNLSVGGSGPGQQVIKFESSQVQNFNYAKIAWKERKLIEKEARNGPFKKW